MNSLKITSGLIDQHIHGAFGVDLANCSCDDVIFMSEELFKNGITMFFPTLVTDSIQNLKKQISVIKSARDKQPKLSAEIIGIHLEGPFISPRKRGIHDLSLIQKPNIEQYKELEDEIIKIVTIAPEEDDNQELCSYLASKGVKVSAGHTLATNISCCDQVTHLFNAMGTIDHKNNSTATTALNDDRIFTELIADGIHINDEVLKLVFKIKPKEKILLISDALPISHSDKTEMIFCSEKIYLKDNKATDKNGTIAGSSLLLNDIVKRLFNSNIVDFGSAIQMSSTNQLLYHSLNNNAQVFWDNDCNIVDVRLA